MAVTVALISLPGCRPQPETTLIELAGGKQVAVIQVGVRDSEDVDGPFYVDYISSLPIQDYVELSREAEEVWAHYRDTAERRIAEEAIVTAHDHRDDDATAGFLFLRDPHGNWDGPEVRTLLSGNDVVVISAVERLGSHGPTLFVDYVTHLPINDRCGLVEETREVWSAFGDRAGLARIQKVFVSPNDAPFAGSSTSFGFTRSDIGEWQADWTCIDSEIP